MPTTYNGIGTHYYGKKNVESRTGTCHSCGHQTTLTSYNTRLWFVVVFIPIIPLGQKRIIDYCSACSRHYVMELKKWETAKQLEISGALDKYRTAPTHENAIAAHQQLLKFHQTAQADEFQKELLDKFGQQALVQCYLGSTLEYRGLHAQAEPHFAKALELRPDLPEARVGVAMKAIRENRLADAAKLLDFLDKPGAAQLYSLEPLEILGNAHQKSGDHEGALRMYDRLIQELPPIAQDKAFRKKVTVSEKALRRTSSILPKTKFSWRQFLGTGGAPAGRSGPAVTKRGLAIAGGVAAVIAILMAVGNNYVKTHRKVFFVNGLSEVENLVIDGREKLTLRGNRSQELALPEGTHTVAVEGPIKKTITFEVKCDSYFQRWFDSPVWIVNPDASACFLYQEVTYAETPPPPREQILFGREWYHLPKVSHPFSSLPDTVKVNSKSETRTLRHVETVLFPLDAFYQLKAGGQNDEAVRLAEIRLAAAPDNEELLQAYLREMKTQADTERARKLLESRLDFRPVPIEWHRAYQSLSRGAHKTEIMSRYESFLQKDPTNSALLYLRGRLDDDQAKSAQFFNKAIAADPQNAHAYYALAYKAWNAGDWQGAKPLLAKAAELRPHDNAFWRTYNLSRIATGDLESLGKELRERAGNNPLDFAAALQLLEVFAAQGRPSDAELLIANATAQARKNQPQSVASVDAFLRGHFLYAAGNFSELAKLSANDATTAGRARLWAALLEQGNISEAEKVHSLGDAAGEDPLDLLSFSLACRVAGNGAKAKEALELALKASKESPGELGAAVALLAAAQAPDDKQIAELSLMPQGKALIAAMLRFQFPEQAARFKETARRFNHERVFPFHLIQRSIAAQ